ncbi:MAG: serine/threonine-protein phosphatase, partial [Rhodothermales bacterium]|nr:serine/threonine-protein phosphatase [Rhodothermales bacterium]
ALHVLVPMDITLEQATSHINRVIARNTDFDKFITYFHCIYTKSNQGLQYVNAGHNPPYVVHSDARVDELEEGGLLLGVMSGVEYALGTTTLAPGDVVAMFTDGVTEAMSPEEEEYGEERLIKVLQEHRTGSAQQILDAVHQEIIDFTGSETMLSDDLTMIVMKVT